MTDAFILTVPDPKHRPFERLPATMHMETLGRFFNVQSWTAYAHDSYSRALRHYWRDPRILINIEHDLAPTVSQVQSLIDCPYPLCAWTFWLAPATTGLLAPKLAVLDETYTDGFAMRPSPGCAKIAPTSRKGEFPVCHYNAVERHLWELCGGPWHLHYPPLVHYHGWSRSYYDGLRIANPANV